jgi:hypothetical protein
MVITECRVLSLQHLFQHVDSHPAFPRLGASFRVLAAFCLKQFRVGAGENL